MLRVNVGKRVLLVEARVTTVEFKARAVGVGGHWRAALQVGVNGKDK